MKRVGEILRKERERKGLTLQEIGMALKINPKMLAAIEAGDSSSLPARTFLRGFIRSYAQYLRLNPQEILQIFNEEVAPEVPISSPESNNELPAESAPKSGSAEKTMAVKPIEEQSVDVKKFLYPAISVLFLVVLIVISIMTLNKYQKETTVSPYSTENSLDGSLPNSEPIQTSPVLAANVAGDSNSQATQAAAAENLESPTTDSNSPNTNPQSNVTTTSQSPSGSALVSSTTTTQKPTTTTAATTTTQKPTTTTAATTTTQKPTTTTAATTTTQKPTTTTAATTTTQKSTTTTLVTTTTSLVLTPNEIIFEATDKVTVRFSSDNRNWQQVDLVADQVHTLRSKGSIFVEINNGGAVNLIVNGKERGASSKIGEIYKAKLP